MDEAAAGEILARSFWRSVVARWRGTLSPVKAEPVWLPTYLVTIPMIERSGATSFHCSVDGLSGAFALFAMGEYIDECAGSAGDFSPRLSPAEADSIARSSLVAAILRRRRKSATAQLGETESVELLRWPYWVFYYRRRNGAMDIALVDAATGDYVGHKIKLGLLDAFRAAARTDTSERK